MSNMLRGLPSVTELLESPPLQSLVNRVSQNTIVSGVGRFLDGLRAQVQSAAANVHVPAPSELAQRIANWISAGQPSTLLPVINATGAIINPQLGGVPLADEAIQAIAAASRGYANLHLDLATGQPCDSAGEVENLLTQLTGAQAAVVASTPAAALWLACAALAAKREVIISRGHLVETDARLSDSIAASGAIMREVGTTNKTRVEDYAAAVSPQTAALIHVVPSNFTILGSEQPSLTDLATLSKSKSLPLIDVLHGASLADLSRHGLTAPSPADALRAGADLVLVAADDLLGGPPCGIALGSHDRLQKIKDHPLLPALAADKLTLAALAATLQLYQNPDLAERSVPVLSLLSTPLENLRVRAERLAPQIAATGLATVEVLAAQSFLRGNSLPGQSLPTICLALTPLGRPLDQFAAALRSTSPAIIGRLENNKLLLDLRSVPPREDLQLIAAIETLRPASEPPAAPANPVG